MNTIRECAREVPLAGDCDVVVCGGGPAGVAAALAAARAGARTTLLERNGCLGGIWTAGLVAWVIDSGGKAGIMAELKEELFSSGLAMSRVERGRNFAFDVDAMKLLLERKCLEAGVDVLLHTQVAAAAIEGRRLSHVITESKSGRQAWGGKAFIDTSGDGDLCAFSGCGFDVGHPETGRVQPMSLCALVAGIDFDEVEAFVGGAMLEPKINLQKEMERSGLIPSYTPPVLLRVRDDNLFVLITNHEYNVSAMDARDITQATLNARQEIHRLVAGLRSLGGVWQGIRVIATADQIGVREARRIHGRHCVSLDEMIDGVRHPDAVCRVSAGPDIHATNPDRSTGFDTPPTREGVRSRPYDIPLRALIAKDIDALLMAGRCISGDFFAHSSYRMTGTAVALGEAAGKVAALGALTGRLPHEVAWEEIGP